MKNLLITTFGEYNHLPLWLNGERNYDVALVNYDYHDMPENLAFRCVWLDTFHTFKFPGIAEMFYDEPRLLRYDYFFMPDEDIALRCEDINTLFDKAKTLNLDLCCPSVEKSEESFPSWELFVHKDDRDFIATNFVEIQSPCFSRQALAKCLPTFKESQSGWGLDIVWPKLIGDTGSNIGIVNSVVAKHTRKIMGGKLYEVLKKKKIIPSHEKIDLIYEYGIKDFKPKEK
jgi:hypothetical protein